MVPPAIELRGLRKSFGDKAALDGVDLVVEPGTVLGYIGANGAGKTTTVRILLGLLTPFEGEVRVAGLDPRADPVAVKRISGYVPENAMLFETMTVAELLLLIGRLRGLDDELVKRRAEEFLSVFDLKARLASRVSSLSKGMRQKVLLTGALLHDPEVLFLDEPLTGLDVNSSRLVKDLLRRLADRGKAVLYCSHVLDVVERVCDRIAILNEGRLIAQGSFEELQEQRGGGSLEHILASVASAGDEEDRVERLVAALGQDGDSEG
ncbi:MAG: ABC transporter ATP-binding protein [Planctomycetota bacterium]